MHRGSHAAESREVPLMTLLSQATEHLLVTLEICKVELISIYSIFCKQNLFSLESLRVVVINFKECFSQQFRFKIFIDYLNLIAPNIKILKMFVFDLDPYYQNDDSTIWLFEFFVSMIDILELSTITSSFIKLNLILPTNSCLNDRLEINKEKALSKIKMK